MDSHLEYDKNDDLISLTQSHKRIINVLLMLAFMFCLILVFLLSIFFNTLSATRTKYYNKQKFTTNYYFQSISKDEGVLFLPIIQSANNSIRSGQISNKFSFPKTLQKHEFQFVYEYQEELVYLHGKYSDYKSYVKLHGISNMKYFQSRNFTDSYLLPGNVSTVEVGQYIWLYGIIQSVPFLFHVILKSLTHLYFNLTWIL